MKHRTLLLITICITLFSVYSCADAQTKQTDPQPIYLSSDYINPVFLGNGPDPSVIRVSNGKFYAYTTASKIFESEDLVNWVQLKKAFNAQSRPSWLEGGAVWATDINYINGRYVLYYALSKWGEQHENGIGVAVASTPEGPFTDQGAMFTSDGIGVQNSIDPCYYMYDGKHYLAWGSWHGIWLAELDKDALKVNSSVPLRQLAGTLFEAPMIHKRGDYYYLFCSIGSCCAGLNSTYQTVVCRSENFFGPYVDKEGKPMLKNNYELVLSKNNAFVGPGHNSELITDDMGKTWFLYHAFDVKHPEAERCIMLDEVKWDSDGWPYVENNGPSHTLQKGPVFRLSR